MKKFQNLITKGLNFVPEKCVSSHFSVIYPTFLENSATKLNFALSNNKGMTEQTKHIVHLFIKEMRKIFMMMISAFAIISSVCGANGKNPDIKGTGAGKETAGRMNK